MRGVRIIDPMSKDFGVMGSGAALPKPGQSTTDFLREHSRSLLQSQKTVGNLIRAVGKMDAIAEMEVARLRKDPEGRVACKAGCDHCCHRVVVVGVTELIQIAQRLIEKSNPAQRHALQERCRQYAVASEPFRAGQQAFARAACPFLLGHMCSIYDVRPIGCRGWNSYSVQACELRRRYPEAPPAPLDARQNNAAHFALTGHIKALHDVDLDSHFYDLGLALPEILNKPELIDEYLAGRPILLEHAIIQPGRDTIREELKLETQNSEPSGFVPVSPIPGHPIYEFMRVSVPPAFSSQDEIDRSLERFRRRAEDLAEAPMEPGRAFDALSQFQTSGLAYTGEDVTELMRFLGRDVVAPVVARALPDLAEPLDPRRPNGRVRVGYLSTHMFAHNDTKYVLGWLANHGEDIESFVFHTGPIQDNMTLLFRSESNHFYHLPGDVPSTARFIKSLELDVLVFTDISNQGGSYQYAAMRLAPVQCAAAGQLLTSGLPTIDYFLSSELMEPANGDSHYTEKLVRLPGSGLCWSSVLPKPSAKSRAEMGIPEGLVYLVAQNTRKMSPKWDFLFAEIQAKTQAPIVFIDFGPETGSEVTKKRIEAAGINGIWLSPMSQPDFVRLQQLCDVSLDTPAWNGANTTVNGLAMGRPIVTLPGPFLRSRHSLGFMTQANVEGLIAHSPEEYIALATDLDRLEHVMKGIHVNGMLEDPKVTPAFDEFLRRVSTASPVE